MPGYGTVFKSATVTFWLALRYHRDLVPCTIKRSSVEIYIQTTTVVSPSGPGWSPGSGGNEPFWSSANKGKKSAKLPSNSP